jgi:protein SCO1/2
MRFRPTHWLLGFVSLAVVAVAVYVGVRQMASTTPQRSAPDPVAAASGKVAFGGPFTLVDHGGRPVTEQTFRGQYTLVFFGFTYCPDVCPTTLADVATVLERLGPLAERVQPLFITVDPERDSPSVLASYVQTFHPRIVGLTGTPEQVHAAAKAYKVYYRKVDDGRGGYLMEHTAVLFLADPEGRHLEILPREMPLSKMAELVRRHLVAAGGDRPEKGGS